MKHNFILFAMCLMCTISVCAQDARLAGVWKRHITGPGNAEWDRFIRVDIDGLQAFVYFKEIGKTDDGKPFMRYKDAKRITINTDGSISFNIYYCEREYDNEDRLYWTVWDNYIIRYAYGRLNVTERGQGYGANSQGGIIKDQTNLQSSNNYIYFNVKDDW